VPAKLLQRVIELLKEHQEEVIEAFHATMAHRFPGTLDVQEES
jgi:hypothetical protein